MAHGTLNTILYYYYLNNTLQINRLHWFLYDDRTNVNFAWKQQLKLSK